MLQQLQTQAQQVLRQVSAAPQRYGTAFHINPPWPEIAQIPITTFTPQSGEIDIPNWDIWLPYLASWQPGVDDPYYALHMCHVSTLGIQTVWVPAGMTQTLILPRLRDKNASRVVWVLLEAGATVTIIDEAQDLSFGLQRLIVVQQAASECIYWGLRTANTFFNEKIAVYLAGEGSSFTGTHCLIGSPETQTDVMVNVYHRAPRTSAHTATRIVGSGESVTVYRGRLEIDRVARGSTGYQQGRALLLASRAVVDMLPELAINTNDVRCSHGVTTLHLDDAALFYLRSRGLSARAARRIAIDGFLQQDLVWPPSLRALMHQAVAGL